jgi:hypothetical protein
MMSTIITTIFISHRLADFVFQTGWMAKNKSKDWLALSARVVVYSVIMLAGLLLSLGFRNGLIHFATDAVTSRFSSYFYRSQQNSYFWWTIGFDQCVHNLTFLSPANALLIQPSCGQN